MEDPIEKIVREGLDAAEIVWMGENGTEAKLDFFLPDYDVHIEVKQFHSDRIAEQMSRATNVIAIQGREAAEFFADRLKKSAC